MRNTSTLYAKKTRLTEFPKMSNHQNDSPPSQGVSSGLQPHEKRNKRIDHAAILFFQNMQYKLNRKILASQSITTCLTV